MSFFGDLNEVRLLGNITSDIELRYTSSSVPVCNFGLATNRSYKQGEEWKDETEFHNIVVWNNLAQGLAQRAHKGTRILVLGRLQTRSWEGADGKKNYKTEIIASDIHLIDRYEKGKSDELPAAVVAGPAKDDSGKPSKSKAPQSFEEDIIDPDDLPF
jgi:single-strand DNA-binding protein